MATPGIAIKPEVNNDSTNISKCCEFTPWSVTTLIKIESNGTKKL